MLLLLLGGCASLGGGQPRAPDTGDGETGLASYYSDYHQGRRTASGEAYDKSKMTAAHRSLPFGTRVRVRNLDNGREVVVRVNDRGPFVPGRVIDLSRRAAQALDMLDAGVVLVVITPE